MGSQIYADSKLQYYPTSPIITTQILSILSSWISEKQGYYSEYKKLEEELKEKYYKLKENPSFNARMSDYITYYMCNNMQYHEIIHSSLGDKTIADLFAGEGEWLKTFKLMCNEKSNNVLIGNELEENRYNTMVQDNLIDYHYNLAFEELQLPKHLIDIMLYNPPYGITNGERNVRRYLKIIFDRELMNYCGSIIVFVVKKDDLLNVVDLITQYCSDILGYKSHQEEFEKFGQYILFVKVRNNPLDLNKSSEVAIYKEELQNNIDYINSLDNICFSPQLVRSMQYCSSNKNIKAQIENFEYIKNNPVKVSKTDKAWKWIIRDTELTDLSEDIITIPKQLKSGELANILASGKINGEISLENGLAKHIAVGGVKNIQTESKVSITNRQGETETKLQTIIQNLPYLNLLINNNGTMQIKELINNPNTESEDNEE